MHKYPYKWYLKQLKTVDENMPTVFSCFAGGGGSSMGYKLAGFNVLGFNEIDKKQAACYIYNLSPKFSYIEDICKFRKHKDIPKELFNLDILDGSPPCTPFSIAGKRNKTWGIKKKFREGQEEQIIDTLSFEFIKLVKKLQPKVVIIENVPDILLKNSIKYVAKMIKLLDSAGYFINKFILNSVNMGVPQVRKRFFLIAIQKKYIQYIKKTGLVITIPKLNLNFNESKIFFSEIEKIAEQIEPDTTKYYFNQNTDYAKAWQKVKPGQSLSNAYKQQNKGFTHNKIHPNFPIPIIISGSKIYHYNKPRFLSITELKLCSTFPLDYDFLDSSPQYILGMSVPPIMIAQIANQIKKQWLDKIINKE